LPNEGGECVTRGLEEVFRERGAPKELLMDNSTTFHSQALGKLCIKWGVERLFRCAYRAQGNGIVERNHRTIKRMAARTGKDVFEMLFWYNFTPRKETAGGTAPCVGVNSYRWRCPGVPVMSNKNRATISRGWQDGFR
jgi:transposase InsO family protein